MPVKTARNLNGQAALYERLRNTIKKYHPGADLELLDLTYEFAGKAHENQLRASGVPYITHPLSVAITLAEMKVNLPIIQAALLHDVPEDTSKTLNEIKNEFGADVASMVAGITKLGKIKYRGIERYIENLRKMFIAMASDIRVVFIKFADRLHNLETIDYLPETKRYRIALETLEIYAPIANRLGMGEIRGRLEDLAFKYVYPKEYEWTVSIIKESYNKKEASLEDAGRQAKIFLKNEGVEPLSIHGRKKHIYSLYKKLLAKDRDIAKIYDVLALRIVVRDLAECYSTLGIIHKYWKPLKGRIKDYIAQPKPNGYRSLHTTVFCDDGEIIEVQIRTQEIHEEAEYGVVAHWRYDEAGKKSTAGREIKWMQDLAQIQKEFENKKQFLEGLEALKIDVFHNHIFVFTPQGDVIDLPEDATPVDFAYAIHSDIGNQCVGAVINEQIAPLDTPLKNGDVVHIITNKDRKNPNADWLKTIKTRNAKNKIRTGLNANSAGLIKRLMGGGKKV